MANESTTSTALEQARRSFEAADSGDYEWMISFYGPNSTFDMSPWGLGTYEGLVAIKAFFKDWIGAFDEFEMKLEELVDLGNGVVFAVAHQNAASAGKYCSPSTSRPIQWLSNCARMSFTPVPAISI